MAEGQGDDGRRRPEGGHGHGGIHGEQRDDDVHDQGGVHGGQRDDDGHSLRLHGPPLDDHVGGVSGEEDEQRTHVGLVANEVCNEELVHKYRSMIPKVGMTFQSEDEVYEMYNSYAGKVGFSIRKSKTKRRGDGSLCQKFIVCSNQGFRENEESKKDITRTGCDARVQLSISKEGIWRVNKVVEQHNHYLASPNKAHKLRSQRQIIEADRKLIGQIREAGLKPAQIYEFMKQFYGGEENIPFSKMDCNNEIGRERREYLEANDAHTLSEYLRNKQLQDPTFFYAVQVDKEDGRIANFFWADGQSIMDYICFGDAISFDTTFKTNKFEMPFAPILGCNHHKQTIIFGCALLFNETIESFVWLFETFLTAMSGKHPNTIFTDQDAAMAGAIAFAFPYTTHRLCLWHICLNAAKHLAHVIHEADKEGNKFLSDFKSCVYEDRSETYFIEKWNQLLAKYKLENNSWMANLYALRAKWAAVYRDSFTADMNSTQRSEGMNNVFKKRFRRKLGLSELLVECEKVAASLRANELDADFQSRRKNPVPYISNLPMLKTAADSYTRRMYSEFEEEFKRQFTLSCDLLEAAGTNLTFFVKFMESTHGATVVFNNEDLTITCSCRMFECIGLLCKHALRVLNMNRVYNLSSQYILPRWTKYAKSGFYIEKQGSETGDLQTQAALLSRQATSLALKCSPSKELLDKVQKAIHNLNLEADIYLTEMREKTNEVSSIPTGNVQQPSNGCISFRIPEVIKGSKNARFKNVVEKNAGKKKKGGQKKGELQNNEVQTRDEHAGPSSAMGAPVVQVGYDNSTLPQFNLLDPSAMVASYIPGGYTRLLMGVDEDASIQNAARKLHFDGAQE